MRDFFSTLIRPYEDPWYRYSRVLSSIESHLDVRPGSSWLDLGCQVGQFVHLVQQQYQVDATGIDQFKAEEIVDICKIFLKVEIDGPEDVFNGRWTYQSGDLSGPRFDLSDTFDFISALEVIEHIIDTGQFIDACRSHLNPKGYLVISTPNINSLRNRAMVPLGHYPAGLEYRNKIHHVRLYNRAALVSQMQEHGFNTISISGVSFLPARMLSNKAWRSLDMSLSDRLPTLCGNLVGIFQRSD